MTAKRLLRLLLTVSSALVLWAICCVALAMANGQEQTRLDPVGEPDPTKPIVQQLPPGETALDL